VNGGEEAGDRIDGGSSTWRGGDTLRLLWQYAASGLTLDASGSVISFGAGTEAVNIENLEIEASEHGDDLRFGAGSDVISGRGGNDTVDGGAGDDSIFGGAGADRISGGAGDDHVVLSWRCWPRPWMAATTTATSWRSTASTPDDVALEIDLAAGFVTGDVQVSGFERLRAYGTRNSDRIVGGTGADRILSLGGEDRLEGCGGKRRDPGRRRGERYRRR
jgi:Ca2+-binding RTX toxin-like protein